MPALQSQAASLPLPAQPPLSLFGPCARQQRHACAAQAPQEEARERGGMGRRRSPGNLGGELDQQLGGGGDHGVVVTDWGEQRLHCGAV